MMECLQILLVNQNDIESRRNQPSEENDLNVKVNIIKERILNDNKWKTLLVQTIIKTQIIAENNNERWLIAYLWSESALSLLIQFLI